MKKAAVLMLTVLLILSVLSVPALAGDQGALGRLTKLNVDEDTLNALKKQYIDDVISGEEPEAVMPEHFDGAKTLKVAGKLSYIVPASSPLAESGEN